MKSKDEVQSELVSLASLLDKLLKVIHHSDPTADDKKRLLYGKYKERLQRIALELKRGTTWEEVRDLLTGLPKQAGFLVSEIHRQTVLQKLQKDIEEHFVTKPVFQEFGAPTAQPPRRKRRAKAPIKPKIAVEPERTFLRGRYTEESILDLIHTTKQQHHAKKELIKLIEAIKRIGPESLEEKITQHVNKK